MLAQLAQLGFAIGGGILGNKSAKKQAAAARQAAEAQAAAYDRGIAERRAGTDEAVGYLSPYEEAGRGGMDMLAAALGALGPDAQRAFFADFQDDPGFGAVQKAGLDSVAQSRSVGGGLKSGGTMKALMDYGQRLKQTVFQDRLNRLADLGKTGVTTAANMASLTDSGSRDIAGYEIGKGAALGGGIINASNAEAAGTKNLINMLGYGAGAIGGMGNDLLGKFKMPGGSTNIGNPTMLGGFY